MKKVVSILTLVFLLGSMSAFSQAPQTYTDLTANNALGVEDNEIFVPAGGAYQLMTSPQGKTYILVSQSLPAYQVPQGGLPTGWSVTTRHRANDYTFYFPSGATYTYLLDGDYNEWREYTN